jgi:regulator of nucleoside diphosphate kinase
MTEKKAMYIVSRAVAAAEVRAERYYHVCWWQDQVQCQHVHHTKEAHEVFYSASGGTFLDGLSPFQWQLVTTRIMDFCRQRGIDLRLRSGRRREGRRHGKSPRRLTEFDSLRLRVLLASARGPKSKLNAYLDRLQELLETAEVVAPRDIPGDVVTMNSKVRLRDDHAEHEMALSLVFPADAACEVDSEKSDVSVLSPLGLSILGRKTGDCVEGRIRIHELLYQPEAAGDFDL